MKIQETTEYIMVKQLTSKDNRSAVKRIIFQGLLLTACCFIGLHLFLNAGLTRSMLLLIQYNQDTKKVVIL